MIWGDTHFYNGIADPAILNATQNFIQYNEDPKAAVIITGELTIESLVYVWVIFFFYNGTTPAPRVFDEFNAIAPVSDSVITQPYASLVGSCSGCMKLSIANQVQLNANNEYSIHNFRYLYRVSEPAVLRPKL